VSRYGNGPLGGAAGGDAARPDGQFAAANHAGIVTIPPTSWLAAAVLGTLLAVAVLASIPARIGARRPVSEIPRADTA
jgi:hypothetical protein